jgi:hypothetical protein
MNRITRAAFSVAPAIVIAAALVSCSTGPALSEQDAEALATLAEVAGPTSDVDPDAITSTECWLPSDHPIDDPAVSDTSWRVLCRAHYTDDSGERYLRGRLRPRPDARPLLPLGLLHRHADVRGRTGRARRLSSTPCFGRVNSGPIA